VPVEEVAGRDPLRPSGIRFGTLAHAVLAEVSLALSGEAALAACTALAAAHGRSLGATAEEITAAARAAAAALAHPLLRRAAKSADCRRETELFQRLPDGTLLEGVVDLAFAESAGAGSTGAAGSGVRWTVVDFKTDARPGLEPRYQIQLRLYAAAIEAATGRPASAILLAI
jgi:ATP-dependent helicase/nuclease subunit A